MRRKGRKIKRDLNMVECGECKRWCYLEETDFESVRDVERSTLAFYLCEKIEEVFRKLEREWKAKFEEMKEELKEEQGKRVLLEMQVAEFKRVQPEECEGKLDHMGAKLNAEREKRTELEKQVEKFRQREAEEGQTMIAELQGIVRVEVKKRVDLEAQWKEMKRESTAKVVPEVQRAREQGASSAHTKEVSRTYSEAAQKEKETTRLIEPNLVPVVNGGGSSVVPVEGGQPSAVRRVQVVGDSNVARIVEGVLVKVKKDKRVQVEAQPGNYMVGGGVLCDNREGENLVLIHARLDDVLNRRRQNPGKQLRQTWVN
ncbi:hypothetical protein HPB47_004094 [Ixodes persulcatus]|uniref:Uncharacterized protein n=1 Tax=Ixodes persulcatus TaxID=34615 RepID=A0AC60PGT9_IXOPE|nr:hypothetical protein HPB47_004094 [Ixodes persulcatus]